MYLLNISNFDYVMMTVLFGSIFICAYKFRRNNWSSHDFLFGRQNLHIPFSLSLVSFGLIEFTILGSYGAYGGLIGILLGLPVFVILEIIAGKQIGNDSLLGGLMKPAYYRQRIIILMTYVIIMLLASGVAIAIIVSLLKSLLGWEFANSTLSLIAIVAVCLLLGGAAGLAYGKVIVLFVSGVILAAVIAISYHNIGYGQLISNLHQAALDNRLPINFFTAINQHSNLFMSSWLIVLVGLSFIVINPFAYMPESMAGQTKVSVLKGILKLVLIAVMTFTGILALATPNKQPVIAGKKIVTVQTRLDNGELGYLVRAVPGNQVTLQRGIIPVRATDSDDETLGNQASGNFDFTSASLIIVKKAIPYAFVSLFLIILLFFKTVSDNILFATLIIIQGLYAPKFNKSGEELENLWAARVFMFALFVIAICVGLVLFKFFNLYYMLALLLIFSLPIALTILFGSGKWLFDFIIYLVLLVMVLTANVADTPSLLPLIKFNSLADMVAKISMVGGLLFIILQLPVKYLSGKHER